MPVLRKQFDIAKLDLNSPRVDAIRLAVDRLAKVDVAFKGAGLAEKNRVKRLKWLKEFKENDGNK